MCFYGKIFLEREVEKKIKKRERARCWWRIQHKRDPGDDVISCVSSCAEAKVNVPQRLLSPTGQKTWQKDEQPSLGEPTTFALGRKL